MVSHQNILLMRTAHFFVFGFPFPCKKHTTAFKGTVDFASFRGMSYLANIPGIFSAAEGDAKSSNLQSRKKGKAGNGPHKHAAPPQQPVPAPSPVSALANKGFIRPPGCAVGPPLPSPQHAAASSAPRTGHGASPPACIPAQPSYGTAARVAPPPVPSPYPANQGYLRPPATGGVQLQQAYLASVLPTPAGASSTLRPVPTSSVLATPRNDDGRGVRREPSPPFPAAPARGRKRSRSRSSRGRRRRTRSRSSNSDAGYASSTSARLRRIAQNTTTTGTRKGDQHRPRDRSSDNRAPPREDPYGSSTYAAKPSSSATGGKVPHLSANDLLLLPQDSRLPEWQKQQQQQQHSSSKHGASTAADGTQHLQLKQRVNKLVREECTAKVSNQTIANLQAVCMTLCESSDDVKLVLGVLEDELAQLKSTRRSQQMLRIWYLIDGLLKCFKKTSATKPALLNAVLEALPRLVDRYVPWSDRILESELLDKFSDMFKTWRNIAPQTLFVRIANLEMEY